MRRITNKKFLLWWALAGLLVPLVFELIYWLIPTPLLSVISAAFAPFLWPSSILLVVLDGQVSILDIISVFTLSIGINIILYTVIGAIIQNRINARRDKSKK